MRSKVWTILLVGTALLLLLLGVVLLAVSRQPVPGATPPLPTATPTATAEALPTVTLPPPPTITPSPYLYTVEEGDTLFSIALAFGLTTDELIAANNLSNPDLLSVGQQLVIPGRFAPTPEGSPTPGPLLPTVPPATPLPTPTPSGPPVIEIAAVLGAGDLESEIVRVRNRGGAVSLENWSLADARGNRFVFPRLVLFPGGEVTIHTASGQSTPTDLYWRRTVAAWESGGLITLRDGEGVVVDTYIVP